MQVRQAANVLNLLEFFARRGEPATLTEIADGLGWPRSSTFNIVGTLVDKGFFYEPRLRGGYYPSPRWLSVSEEIAANDPLPEAIRRLVDRVGLETGETTAIGSLSGLSVMFLHVCQSRQSIRYTAEVGSTVPLHASSAGRAILAQMERRKRDAYYRKIIFEQFSDRAPTGGAQVEEELRAAHQRGYHQSESEFIPDLAGVAMPLPFSGRRLSIVVAGPVSRCLTRRPQFAQAIHGALRDMGLGGE